MKIHPPEIRSDCHARKLAAHLGALILALFPVTAHCLCLLCSCSVSASGVAFGNYSFTTPAPTDATGNVQVSCSGPLLALGLLVSYDILLSTGGSASFSPRIMASGANQLQYNLYTDAGHSIIWGNGTGGTSIVSDSYLLTVLVPVVRNYPVYGRLPASQNTPAGAYTDTITVTINY